MYGSYNAACLTERSRARPPNPASLGFEGRTAPVMAPGTIALKTEKSRIPTFPQYGSWILQVN